MGFCLFSHPWDWVVSLRVTTATIDLVGELPQSLNRSCFPLILTLELSIPPGALDDIETYLTIYISSFASPYPYFGRWVSALFPNFVVTMVLRIFAFAVHSQLLALHQFRLLVLPLLVPLQ